jgi:hypothetical protein
MEADGVPFKAELGKVTPDDSPDGGVYGSGWVCDINGEPVADYKSALLAPGDEVYFYYNPNGIGQMFARLTPGAASVKDGTPVTLRLTGKRAGTSDELEPIAGADVYIGGAPTARTNADGTAVIDTGELSAGSYEVTAEYSGGGSYNILTYNSALITVKADEPDDPPSGGDGGKPSKETEAADTPSNLTYRDGTVVAVPASGVRTFKLADLPEDIRPANPTKDELEAILKENNIVSGDVPDLALNESGEAVADAEAISDAIDAALADMDEGGETVDRDNLLLVPLRTVEVPGDRLEALGDEKATVIFTSKVDLAARFDGARIGSIIALKEKADGAVERLPRTDLEAISHGKYAWTGISGGAHRDLPADTKIAAGGEYFLHVAARDDSDFDLNKTPGIVSDPVILAEDTAGGGDGDIDGGSGGGCSSAAFGMASMLAAIASVSLALRRKNRTR